LSGELVPFSKTFEHHQRHVSVPCRFELHIARVAHLQTAHGEYEFNSTCIQECKDSKFVDYDTGNHKDNNIYTCPHICQVTAKQPEASADSG
jgi:hypothetical protein